MKFRAGELEFNATVADGSQAPSPQTGNILRSLTIQFRAQKIAMHEQALVEAQQRELGGVFSLDDSGEPETEWRVRQSSSTYIGTEPYGINHHVWQLDQVERLACTRLLVGPVTLEPYDYTERVADDGTIRLAARGLVSESDLDGLSRVPDVADVVRVGMSEVPRRMVVEGYVWGAAPAGPAVAIVCADVREPRVTLDGVQAWPRDDALQDLIGVLQEKRVFDDHDLETLTERIRQRRHAARRIENLDAWKL
jgi:hypothetical protein